MNLLKYLQKKKLIDEDWINGYILTKVARYIFLDSF